MPSTAHDRGSGLSFAGPKRVLTLRVPTVLDQNIEAFSITQGKLKSEIIIEAITIYLQNNKLQPNKPPRLSLSY
jgi:hypothetical protein